MQKQLKIVLMGPPGCGKGTQGKMLENKYMIPQLSTGDMLRAAIREGTKVGMIAKEVIDRGALVTDEVMLGIMEERLSRSDCVNGYILDGFPRTLGQAEGLDTLLDKKGQSLSAAINLEVADEEVVKRLAGRRQCKKCGTGFHLMFKKSAKEGICDACGGELYGRDDDNENTIRERLSVYNKQTAPLLNYYGKKGLLISLKGTGSIEDIFGRVCSLIDEKFTGISVK